MLSLVDVPGHERFVRTMVAGATGVDLALLVVAADDGVMPQTREHLAVLRALAVDELVVAVTKTDLAEPARAIEEIGALVPGAPVVAVCAPRGEGVAELLAALDDAAARTPSRAAADGPPRLHVDRVFTVRGAGTVVTGTLWSGRVARGDRVVLVPSGRPARVRGVHVHDEPLDAARAGQRVALNLVGVDREEVERGDVVTTPEAGLTGAHILDVALDFTTPPREGERVQVHHGTRETPGRIVARARPLAAARDRTPARPPVATDS